MKDSQIARVKHPGWGKTLSLVKRSFTWLLMTAYMHRYIDWCNSSQRVKYVTHKPCSTLEPLPQTEGTWMSIICNFITGSLWSERFDSILTMIDQLTNTAHLKECTDTMVVKRPEDQILRYMWKLHGKPKTILSDWWSICILQVTKERNKHLWIELPPYMVCHLRTNGQSDIDNKDVKQYVEDLTQYYQDDWKTLMPTAKFGYNNNKYATIWVSLFKDNCGYNPKYDMIP